MGENHKDIVLAHEERFKTIFNRIKECFEQIASNKKEREDRITRLEDTINCHVKDSADRILMIERHELILSEWDTYRKEVRRWGFGVVIILISGILYLGGRLDTLNKLEKIHEKELVGGKVQVEK
jgi:hypothetical protein